ncbi:MAG: prolyl oligopeptidase family serine peptidase [Planctomycetales bacterium]|nr:prolyl oligopeptidase family serine peptidase [Planctomycetales bacterium]
MIFQETVVAQTQVASSETTTHTSNHRFLLYLPKDYDQKDSHPLLLFLHGAGERGGNIEKVKIHGPPKLIENGRDLPFVVVSPQCEADQWWDPSALNDLLDVIVSKYKIDKQRIYVTGLSMGGFGTWALLQQTPTRFAAAIPICGGGNSVRARHAKRIGTPIWAFHGAKDAVVPLEESQKMVDAVKATKGDAQLTVYPDAEHDSWTKTYQDDAIYEWLLKHSKAQ